jgi:hypothetical protein
MKFSKLITDIVKGLFIGILYLQLTKTNDTNLQNIAVFSFFYVVLINGAHFAGVDPIIVTNAFITKTVFTLVDERIKKNDEIQEP